MADASVQPDDEARRLVLLKLDGEPLKSLLVSASPSLAAAVRRVVGEAAERTANFAAFGNVP